MPGVFDLDEPLLHVIMIRLESDELFVFACSCKRARSAKRGLVRRIMADDALRAALQSRQLGPVHFRLRPGSRLVEFASIGHVLCCRYLLANMESNVENAEVGHGKLWGPHDLHACTHVTDRIVVSYRYSTGMRYA